MAHTRVPLLLALLTLAAACGGGSSALDATGPGSDGGATGDAADAPAGGSNSVTFMTADNMRRTISGSARARAAATPSNTSLYVTLDGGAPSCGARTTAVGAPWLELAVFRAGSTTPIQAGTYMFLGGSDAHAEGYIHEYGTGCAEQDVLRNGGTYSGTLTLTSVTDTEVVGTFDFDAQSVTPSGTGHASGAFNATICTSTAGPTCTP